MTTTRTRIRGATRAGLLLALAPFAVVAVGARVLVPRLGDGMARTIASLASAVPRPPPSDAPSNEPSPPEGEADGGAGVRAAQPAPRAAWSAPRVAGIDVPAARLARLTERQLRGIGATTVTDGDGNAVGARLSGVSALGVGLADGDVVTSIDGQATPTGDAATAAALGAWGGRRGVVRGTVLRGEQTIAVTVHVPVVDAGGRP